MASWEPADIDQADRDQIEVEDDKWDDKFTRDLKVRLDGQRRFNATLETSDNDVEKNITLDKLRLKKDTIVPVANQIYDKMTKLFNDTRKRSGIKGGDSMEEPIRNYDNFDLDDNG